MNTIYKYPLQITDEQVVKLPENYEILSVQMQGDTLCIWALVDTDEEVIQEVSICIFGTGNPIDKDITKLGFLGTIQQGPFMWHVFEQY